MRAPTRGEEATGTRRSRLRIVVIQALVLSLFATLLVRLYYLQVVTGEEYTAQAASQSVRDIVVQPQRGLIVDDMGRPLVTNRTAWVVSVDRTLLGKMGGRDRREVLNRVAASSPVTTAARSRSAWSPAATRARSAAPAGTARPTSRSRSPPTSSAASR